MNRYTKLPFLVNVSVSLLVGFASVSRLGVAIAAGAQPPSAPAAEITQHVTILQTTDIHDHANGAGHVGLDASPLTGVSLTGAYARIAAYVNHVRSTADHPVILVDSGDWTMGTLYDLTLGDRPLALFFLQAMGFDCVTLGNHEFDYATAGLARMLGAAQSAFAFRIPIVATNMNLGGDSDLTPFVGRGKAIDSTRIDDLTNGLRVGYIGLMGHNAAGDIATAAPVTFWDPSANYAAIQAVVDALRGRGVEIVIALSHSGTDATGTTGEDVELAKHVRGIDVIASGHTHTPLPSARTVQNGGWNTYIVDAGWAGSNVSRLDLSYRPSTKTTVLDGSSNPAMTDASLVAMGIGLPRDPLMSLVVRDTDQQINTTLTPFFSQTFPDYNPLRIGTGIYHTVGTAAQDMAPNNNHAGVVPAPNGLGDLAADAVRAVGNGIIAQTLAAVGGNPANAPGFDFTPIQAAVVPSGLLRGDLRAGVPLSFADVYNIMPLGFTPDSTQALPVAYPLISTYFEPSDVKKICAVQLVVQSGLASPDFYVNISGLQYTLRATESYNYFKHVTAAAALQLTAQKASAGSLLASQALAALSSLASDGGAALLAAYATGNPYAVAMVALNDTNPGAVQIAANLAALGRVAAAAAADSANGTTTLATLVTSSALAAVDTVSGFAPNDDANIGSVTVLPEAKRVRIVVDLYTLLLINAIGGELGLTVTPYQSASGTMVLSPDNLPAILSNRVDAAPGTPGLQELKGWMALLSFITSDLSGRITPIYASTSDFSQFASFGNAVRLRNASYPVTSLGQLLLVLGSLRNAP
jgi:5'-nucleotidase/UDP-sugar diphosphatase